MWQLLDVSLPVRGGCVCHAWCREPGVEASQRTRNQAGARGDGNRFHCPVCTGSPTGSRGANLAIDRNPRRPLWVLSGRHSLHLRRDGRPGGREPTRRQLREQPTGPDSESVAVHPTAIGRGCPIRSDAPLDQRSDQLVRERSRDMCPVHVRSSKHAFLQDPSRSTIRKWQRS